MAWLSSSKSYLGNEFFILNLCILASYYFYRQPHTGSQVAIDVPFGKGKNPKQFSSAYSASFPAMEAQIAASLVLTAVMRSYRSTSPAALIATLLSYSQVFVLVNAALTDSVAAVWYLVAFGVVFFLFNEPTYSGPSNIEVLTASLFQEKCLKDSGDGVAYAVFFTTGWSSRCRHAYPLFAELSLRYATDKLRFARADVGTWPRLARLLNLDLSATSSQLPTVACFEAGAEVGRVPAGASSSLSGVSKWTFSKVELIKALQLDARYAKSMGSGPAPAAATPAK